VPFCNQVKAKITKTIFIRTKKTSNRT